eukprot:gene30463-40477_t
MRDNILRSYNCDCARNRGSSRYGTNLPTVLLAKWSSRLSPSVRDFVVECIACASIVYMRIGVGSNCHIDFKILVATAAVECLVQFFVAAALTFLSASSRYQSRKIVVPLACFISAMASIQMVSGNSNCKADMERNLSDFRRYQNISTPRPKFRILVVTHSWGGGTELFEDELLLNKNFEFIFFRVNYKQIAQENSKDSHMRMSIKAMVDSKAEFYTSDWFQPNYQCIESIFSSISYHILMLNFLQPIPEMLEFLKKVNRPLVYAMHDHHAVSYDVVRDMHLDCGITGRFSKSLDVTTVSASYMKSTYKHRWEYAELLRRCIFVTTPCLRNKAIFNAFFPEVTVYAVPNRPTLHRPGLDPITNQSLVYITNSSLSNARLISRIRRRKHPNNSSTEIRLVVLGALSVGKGAHVTQDVSNLCSTKSTQCNFLIFHIGSAANFKKGNGQGNH